MRNKNSIYTVSSILKGQFGINDVALSLPSVTTSDGIKTVYEPELTDDEIRKLLKSAEVCRATLNSISL
jgi:L-lactate dehydrogenase